MDRRDAIKRIGALAAVAAIGSTGLAGASGLIADGVETMRNLGKNISWLLSKIA